VDFFEYQRWFERALSKLKLPSDCQQREPEWEAIQPPYSWQVRAFFDFSDGKHIRLWESHDKFAGLYMSRRVQWSYHYGDTMSLDENGDATQGAPDDPLDLRIDTAGGQVHMHYQKRQPHYRQADIEGLDLAKVDGLLFVRAVLRHRQTGKPLSDTLGFKIKIV
jgi:hypothetical protein